MTEQKTASRYVAPIDTEDEYGGTVTIETPAVHQAPAVVQPLEEMPLEREPEVAPVETSAGRECRVRAMRAFFKLAKESGLDVEDAHRMRQALAYFLGQPVYSRRDLSAGQWREAEAGLWVGLWPGDVGSRLRSAPN